MIRFNAIDVGVICKIQISFSIVESSNSILFTIREFGVGDGFIVKVGHVIVLEEGIEEVFFDTDNLGLSIRKVGKGHELTNILKKLYITHVLRGILGNLLRV